MRILIPFAALLAAGGLSAQTPVVTFTGENLRLSSASVSGSAPSFTITAAMADDNGQTSLPDSFRRWWHFQVSNLPAAATTLTVRITNAGYSDVILPVWSRSTDGGASYGAYTRVPSAPPTVTGTTHQFVLAVPAGVTHLRLAKYFPYRIGDKDALLARAQGHPRVRAIRSLGTSWQGRAIELVELTDGAVADAPKRRVWVHAGIHPAETTSYFVVEGLVDWLLSGSAVSEVMLGALVFDLVPMTNPDGVFLGNYRTNSRSANLEEEWASPYASVEREVVALRAEIERLMGTPQSPGPLPIAALLNLHSSHNVAFPFHFQHVANASFDLVTNRSGVIPAVNALEAAWITSFRARSAFLARGTTQSSALSPPERPFVESMMHDRWSVDPLWTAPPSPRARVMAITMEGTYGAGPSGSGWNTPADYRAMGAEMGRAFGDFFGVFPGGRATGYGTSCGGPVLAGEFLRGPDRLRLSATGAAPDAAAVLVIGFGQAAGPVLPGSTCPLRTQVVIAQSARTDAAGAWSASLGIPATLPELRCAAQLVVAPLLGPAVAWQTSNGVDCVWSRG
jgi:hypothetical protein